LRSDERAALIRIRRTLDGALKCAFRDLRLELLTPAKTNPGIMISFPKYSRKKIQQKKTKQNKSNNFSVRKQTNKQTNKTKQNKTKCERKGMSARNWKGRSLREENFMAAAGTTSGTEKKKKRDGDTLMHLCLFVCLGDKAEQKMGFCILLCFRVSHPQMHQTLISNDSESTHS
jgi:hypothetical protein